MYQPGFGLYWDSVYWASLLTSEATTGRRFDTLFGPVGTRAHHHGWLKIGADDSVKVGAQLKTESTRSRPPSYETTGFTTRTFARF
jgi:hypothetical protein